VRIILEFDFFIALSFWLFYYDTGKKEEKIKLESDNEKETEHKVRAMPLHL
jgi:low temperature requirement protein LtrA